MSPADKKSLVIVESPAKARTIERYLGKEYQVIASMGHVKDLPLNKLGVNPDENFKPEYVTISGKEKHLNKIRKAARSAEAVFLAPDPDREGEAIAWHIANELKKKDNIYRATFNEITRDAVVEAINNPGRLNNNLVEAQQARRILDRLVGYKISPILWKKIQKGLSAGRVQSVAVRMICEREAEIDAFEPQEYWTIDITVQPESEKDAQPFHMRLSKLEGKKPEIGSEKEATEICDEIKNQKLAISNITKKEVKRNPAPPFTTSTLQQEASRKLNFTSKRTMSLAQKLYEGVELNGESVGLITYMRTDSTRISDTASNNARKWIISKYGSDYVPAKPRFFKKKKGAQDAHEAIRPTSSDRDPAEIRKLLGKENRDMLKLYDLIWNRFVASQMASAIFDQTKVEATAGKRFTFSASGQVQKFPGFLALYEEGKDDTKAPEDADPDEETLPELKENEPLVFKSDDLVPNQHFTKPPPRFTEATLVKELEKQGIGRPSTYAAIISVIQDKKYVQKDDRKRFVPTDLGKIITELLVDHFRKILDVKFTALMESQLDEVEEGKVNWETLLDNFWREFKGNLEEAESRMRNLKSEVQKTDIKCDKCGEGTMVIRWGKNGRFLACDQYPRCRNTKPYPADTTKPPESYVKYAQKQTCPKCGGQMVIKMGKWGRFAACSNYPDCKTIEPIKTGVTCPKEGCGGDLVERTSKKGRVFFSCTNYPKCDYVSWEKPIPRECPECGNYYILQGRKNNQPYFKCPKPGCNFRTSDVSLEPSEANEATASSKAE